MKIKKNDIILIAIILCIAGACLTVYMKFGRENAESVIVSVDGKVKDTYSLSENMEVKINETNIIVIENRQVWMKEANCPDQICVHHKSISKNKENIVCLPNKVVIEIKGTKDTNIDSVVN